MRTQTVYVAVDGRQFDDAAKARDHEDRLYQVWLKENPIWRDFLKAHEANMAKFAETVRAFWEWNYGK